MDDGATYSLFIENELKIERARRELQTKTATAVITTSSALIALLVALFALLAGKDFVFQAGARWVVIAALALFFLSAVAALVAGQLVEYLVADETTLSRILNDHWGDTVNDSRLASAWINFDTLVSLRRGCNARSWWLDWALRLQVLGALALALGVGWQIALLP
ncbi:MAG: hypothetical protein KF761_08305 [Salinibacterium sp.]|nr:hypothetical protein [Salinibacterium sp.]